MCISYLVPRSPQTPPEPRAAADPDPLFSAHARELAPRAGFIRMQTALERHPRTARQARQALDPVLRFHLGLPPAHE